MFSFIHNIRWAPLLIKAALVGIIFTFFGLWLALVKEAEYLRGQTDAALTCQESIKRMDDARKTKEKEISDRWKRIDSAPRVDPATILGLMRDGKI